MKSERSKLIKQCDDLTREILILKQGRFCQLCGGITGIGLFHVFEKGTYPRLRYHRENLLLAGWMCCHSKWHHSFYKARIIEKKIKMLKGEYYEIILHELNATAPKLTTVYLKDLKAEFKEELKQLKEKQNGC